MKKFTLLLFVFVFTTLCLTIAVPRATGQPLQVSYVTGDLFQAKAGTGFIGVLYSRAGTVYYNEADLAGNVGTEVSLGTGTEGRLAIDAAGNPHVVFNASGKIAYLYYDGTSWSIAEYIESFNYGGTGNCSKPDIAVDGTGGVHVTYTDSHGSSGDDYIHPDIMYAYRSGTVFSRQLIYRGYRDYSSSGSWAADYYNKGSFIAANATGDYFIMAHRQNVWRWSNGTDNTYYIMIHSNLGSGNKSNYGSDIYTINGLSASGNTITALYKESTMKTSELTVSGTTISFSNTAGFSASSLSSAVLYNGNKAAGGLSGSNLFTSYNSLEHVYSNVVVKGTAVSVVNPGDAFYSVYTDNVDGKIKFRDVATPLSLTRFEFAQQTKPAVIDGQSSAIHIEVAAGSGLTSLTPTYTATSDVTAVTVNSTPQTSGVTTNDYTLPVTYTLSDGVQTRDWQVTVTEQKFSVTTSAEPAAGGTTSGDGNYEPGETVTVTANPNAGYGFVKWMEGTTEVSASASYSFTAAADRVLKAVFAPLYTLTILTTGNGSAEVDGVPYTSELTFVSGKVVDLKAIAGPEYHFVNWTGDLSSASNPAAVTMDADKTITANFAINQYTLTIITSGNGTVEVDGSEYVSVLTFDSGTEVDLEAIAAAEHHFTGWSGGLVSTDNPASVTMTGDLTITASFAINQYTLTILTTGNGSVNVGGMPYTTILTYDSGTILQLEAVADAEFHFTGWSGDLVSADNPATVTMTGNKSITASFAINRCTLTILTSGNGSVKVDGVPYTEVLTFDSGTEVTLEAFAIAEHHFTGWSGGLVSTDNPATLTMMDNMTITANFAINQYALTILTTGNGSVEVDGVPYTTTLAYDSGTEVDLEAIAGSEYHFTGWSGGLVSTDNPASVTMTGDLTITANFAINRYTLTIQTIGNGSVDVGGVPYTTILTYDSGTILTLDAVAYAEHHFTGWSGDLVSTDNPATVTMTGNKSITASFAINRYNLTIATSGPGSVKVDGTAYTDVLTFDSGTEVDLEAIAGTEHHFTNWSGDLVSTDNPASVTMTGDLTITANFAINQYTLTIQTTGNGSVNVGGMPYTTIQTYDSGTILSLDAVAGAEYHFTGWSGDLISTDNPATVTMTGNKTITANFAVNRYTLTILTSGNGSVKVGGVTYSTILTFDSGTILSLDAVADAEHHFTGWSGDLVSADNPATVTMTGNKTITASFAINRYTLTILTSGNGSVEVGGVPYTTTLTYDSGTEVDLEAFADAEHHFTGWSGDLVSEDNPVSVTLTGDMTITATFAINQYTLTIHTIGNGSVEVLFVPYTSSTTILTFDSGTMLLLGGIADWGHHFTGWTGDLVSSDYAASLTMTGNMTITANFAINRYTLTIATSGPGSVNVNGTAYTDVLTFDHGTEADLEAIAGAEHHFTGWSPEWLPSGNPLTITMFEDRTITANFAINRYTLAINISGNGSVKVNGETYVDEMTFDSGTLITLEAFPDAEYNFISWAGGLVSTQNPVSFTLSGNKSITARFTGDTTIGPEVVCHPTTVYIEQTGNYTLTRQDLLNMTAGTEDNQTPYADLIITATPGSFTCADVGKSIPVTVTVTDGDGNSSTCQTEVMVRDYYVPQVICKDVTLYLNENGMAFLDAAALHADAYDACGIASFEVGKEWYTCSDLGQSSFWLTVTDNNQNAVTCVNTVTVLDKLPPVFVSVNDLTVHAEQGACTAQFEYPSVQASDNCKLENLYLIKGKGPEGEFGTGTSVESWVAVDSSGNHDTLTFTITVLPFYSDPSVNPLGDIVAESGTEWVDVPLTGLADGSACSADPLSFVLTSTGTSLIDSYSVEYSGSDTGLLKIRLMAGKLGTAVLSLAISNDQSGKTSVTTFQLTIRKANLAPFLAHQVDHINMKSGEPLKQKFSSVKGVIFDDNDEDDILSLSLEMAQGGSLPAWLVFRNDTLFANPAASDTGCVSLRLVAADLSGSTANTTFTLCVSRLTGINPLTAENLKMYPNPSTGKVYIEVPGVRYGNTEVTVRNLLGQVVSRNIYGGENLIRLNLEGNVSGIYLIRVKSGEFEQTRRIILKSDQ